MQKNVQKNQKTSKWSKNFDERAHRRAVNFSRGMHCSVTPTSRQQCRPLQQWRCCAVIDFFAACNATMTHNAFQRAGQPQKLPIPLGDLDPI